MNAVVNELKPASRQGAPRVHLAGAGGVYMDCGSDQIDMSVQRRIWAIADALRADSQRGGIREVVPGVNNLLVLFDPLVLDPGVAREHVLRLWDEIAPRETENRQVEIPVIYGGEAGIDLKELAEKAELGIDDYVAMHSGATYQVVCIGSTPGFSYMSGLPARLHAPRRSSPRLRIPKGAVVIGGVQAGVMPGEAPSGWHILGKTPLEMFDPRRDPPGLVVPGDIVKFVPLEVQA